MTGQWKRLGMFMLVGLLFMSTLTGCGRKIANRLQVRSDPRTAPVVNSTRNGKKYLFSKDETALFQRIAKLDNPRDPDGPQFIYSAKYQLTPDGDGKKMLFDKDEIADYPNAYQVVYYPAYRTVLFSWDAGQADRGCCTYVVMDGVVMKTITAGGLSIQYEKVYQHGVPIYSKEAKADLPSDSAAP